MTPLLRSALRLLPLVILVIGVNWSVDPAHLTGRGTYEQALAELVLDGKAVTNIFHYDDRLYTRYFVAGLRERRDVVVLGSSRTMVIRQMTFPGRRLANSSVSAAMVADHVAIYQMYRQRGLVPAEVVLGVDPWNLNGFTGNLRWKTVQDEYESIQAELGEAQPTVPFFTRRLGGVGRWAELLSPSYFQSSVRSLIDASLLSRGSYRAIAMPGDAADFARLSGLTRLPDGSAIYEPAFLNKGEAAVRAEAVEFGRWPIFWRSFTAIDSDLARQLESFVDLMKRDGVHVSLFLAPLHPLAYQTVLASDRHRMVERVEAYLVRLADEKSLKLRGSFDPTPLCLSEEDFLDPYHPTESAVHAVMTDQTCGRQTSGTDAVTYAPTGSGAERPVREK